MTLNDRRQISFTPEALAAAITASPTAAASLGLPPLKPQCVRLVANTGTVEVVFQTSGGARSVSISLLQLAALLLAFCLRAKIPLPRKARKSARIEGNTVVLDFTMEFEADLPGMKPEGAMPSGGGARSLDWGTTGATRMTA
jgi:hypothetical protein